MRIGMGYDVHRLVNGRPLILGGVNIPYEKGLLGHSDADVLTHAICDAVLGAAGLGDLGRHFPDTSEKYKDISSIKLLKQCFQMMDGKGYRIINLDATVLTQAPKIAPYGKEMESCLARALDTDVENVNIKATTTEGLGFLGKGEGIAAESIVLIGPK